MSDSAIVLPRADKLTSMDALILGHALMRCLTKEGVPFAGMLEAAIRFHGHHVDNEVRHGLLCGWMAVALGVTGDAMTRAKAYLDEMRAGPFAESVTEAKAAVVGLDKAVNDAIARMLWDLAWSEFGQLFVAISKAVE